MMYLCVCVCVCISLLVLIHLHSSCTLAALMHASLRTTTPANGNEGNIPKREKRLRLRLPEQEAVVRKTKSENSEHSLCLCPYLFIPSLYLQDSLSLSLSPFCSLPLTHWRMLTHQVPWLPSMGWCHFRWHHHAVYVCLCPPSTLPSPPPPAALPLFLPSEGRCCLTHTRYTQTIGQTALLAQAERERESVRERAGQRRMRDTDCQEGRNIYTKKEESWSLEQ